MLRSLAVTVFVFATLLACSLVGGRSPHAHRHAHAGAVVATKGAWSALRASLRAAAHDAADSRRTAIDEDDDDYEDDEAITNGLSVPSRGGEDASNDAGGGVDAVNVAAVDDARGRDPARGRPSDGAIRVSRGFDSGTDRPPRRS